MAHSRIYEKGEKGGGERASSTRRGQKLVVGGKVSEVVTPRPSTAVGSSLALSSVCLNLSIYLSALVHLPYPHPGW